MWVVKEYAKAIIALVILALLLWLQSSYEFTTLPASTKQMEPAIPANSIYMLHQTTGPVNIFKHEDIVFFSFKSAKDDRTFVSRVVGLPGDSIEIRDGKLFRNNESIIENYLPEQSTGFNLVKITVPRDHLYVLNDSRASRSDSRTLGPIPWTSIYGRTNK